MVSEITLFNIVSMLGTFMGTFGGIIISNKLTTWRIQKLEEKVDKHNTIIERTYILETEMKEVKEDIRMLRKG